MHKKYNMEIISVKETDSVDVITNKLWEKFQVHQSMSIKGLEMHDGKIIDKAQLVIDRLKERDKKDNWLLEGNKRMRRKRVFLINTIGGPRATKMFQYKTEVRDGIKNTTIWRTQ